MRNRDDYRFPYSRYPALRITALFTGGLLLSSYVSAYLAVGSFLTLFCGYIWLDHNRRGSSILLRSRINTWIYLLLIVCSGIIRGQVGHNESRQELRDLSTLAWEYIEAEGVVHSVRISNSAKHRLRIKSSLIRFESRALQSEHEISISLPTGHPIPESGDRIYVAGKIIPASARRNPNDFDMQEYLNTAGILLQITADSLRIMSTDLPALSWQYWRRKTLGVLDQNFSKTTSSLAKAMILGHKDDLDPEVRTAFGRVGLSHIMAVSGLHVGFVIAPFWLFIPWFWHSGKGRVLGLLILLIILFLYAGITGFPASVLRASIMAGLLTAARLFNRSADSLNLMGVAALLILAADPRQLTNVGFQLSFSAVFVILITLPVLQAKIPHAIRYRWYAKPLMVILVSVVVQFGLYPLQAWYFGEVSLISPVANALFVPLLGIMVPLAILALITGMIYSPLAWYINFPAEYYLKAMRSFVELSSEWQWTWFQSSTSGLLIFLLWISMLLFIASLSIPKLRWRWLISVLILLNLISFKGLTETLKDPGLKVLFFDVGQGDAALIRTPGDKHVLVDAGVWSPGYNTGKGIIMPHLKAENIGELDAVILSHPHADHIGGIVDILHQIPVKRIIRSGFPYESDLWRRYNHLADSLQVPVQKALPGDTLLLDPALLMVLLAPGQDPISDDPNQHSVILKMQYGTTSFLFTGDAGEEQEEELRTTFGSLLHSDVLKVGHHGSRTSSSVEFLKEVDPGISVISLGEQNRFGHPHPEAIQRLNRFSDDIRITARDKAIVLHTDGKGIQVVRWE